MSSQLPERLSKGGANSIFPYFFFMSYMNWDYIKSNQIIRMKLINSIGEFCIYLI